MNQNKINLECFKLGDDYISNLSNITVTASEEELVNTLLNILDINNIRTETNINVLNNLTRPPFNADQTASFKYYSNNTNTVIACYCDTIPNYSNLACFNYIDIEENECYIVPLEAIQKIINHYRKGD